MPSDLESVLDFSPSTLDLVGDSSNSDYYPHSHRHKKEEWQHVLAQIIVPFFIAGFGMVAAGVLFDYVQVFTHLPTYI